MHRLTTMTMTSWLEAAKGKVAPPNDELPGREFQAANGLTWRVRELRTADGASLLFESDRVARRVRNFPASWISLSPSELEELSWSR